MIRFLALCGLGGGFLALSPKLRDDALSSATIQIGMMHQYSPYSWVGLAVVGVVSALIYMRRCSTLR
jgi:hypothetical protein